MKEITLEHNGETFDYAVEVSRQCGDCGYFWDAEQAETEGQCPNCGGNSVDKYREEYHFYIKMAWWFDDPEPTVDVHTEALRRAARKLEALEANGWELVRTDGEHIFFERVIEDGPDQNPHKVDETLE